MHDDRSLIGALIGDGRPMLKLTGLSLIMAGLFALFLSVTRHFLPHDVQYLGMAPNDLCAINQCRIVHFMFHDRVSFGGAIIAIGTLYLWLAEFPLKQGQPWAWWLFAVSGLLGFGSFLAYLGYGYLDTWHGMATLGLLPCFALGLARSVSLLPQRSNPWCLTRPAMHVPWASTFGIGRLCLLAVAAGLIAGGAVIMVIGMTSVFVPQDLAYMGLSTADLQAINPRLVPLIAHDRAGFGGAVCTSGLMILFCIWCGEPSRSLWQALCLSGSVGFVTAIGIHPLIGYTDFIHLAPAVAGGCVFSMGMFLTFRPMVRGIAENEHRK